MKRFESLDYMRGVAALAVVIFHRGIHPSFSGLLFLIAKYGEVGVQIFFVISGYVIYQASEKYFGFGIKAALTFLYKRFWRIYPALWISLILSFMLAFIVQSQVFNLFDWLTSFTLTYLFLGYKAPQVVYWSLVFEQQFYIVMAILTLPFFNKYRTVLILSSSIIAVLVTLRVFSNWYVNALLPAHWLEFELGIITFLIINNRFSRKITIPIFLTMVVIGLFGSYRSAAAVIFSCSIFFLAKIEPFVASKSFFIPIRFLGQISYSLYLTHLPVLMVFDKLFQPFFGNDSLLLYFLGIFTTIGMASIFYFFFEKPFLPQKREALSTHQQVVI